MARKSLWPAVATVAVARVAVATVAVALGLLASNAAAARSSRALPVPYGFTGVDVGWPEWGDPNVDLSRQLDNMARSGVDALRAAFYWSQAQPYRSWGQVPAGDPRPFVNVGGVPTDFSQTDALVAAAAQHGMTLLPVVVDAPAWDGRSFRGGQVAIPRTPGPYAAFVRALVLRYGSNGSFWQDNPQIPKLPVEMWQIWNEPNLFAFWPQPPQGYYAGYVALLRAAHAAVKQADPRAKVVLAGLPNYSWIDIQRIEQHGGKNLFDIVDLHPFTATPQGVIRIIGYVRQVLDRTGGARIPIVAGELAWPSSEGKGAIRVGFNIGTTEKGQAAKLAALLPMLARDRLRLRLAGFYYYEWAGIEVPGAEAFDYSGLFRYNQGVKQFHAKPAYYVYRNDALSMEGCRAKGLLATECLH